MISEETIDLYKLKNKQVAAQIMCFDVIVYRSACRSDQSQGIDELKSTSLLFHWLNNRTHRGYIKSESMKLCLKIMGVLAFAKVKVPLYLFLMLLIFPVLILWCTSLPGYLVRYAK